MIETYQSYNSQNSQNSHHSQTFLSSFNLENLADTQIESCPGLVAVTTAGE